MAGGRRRPSTPPLPPPLQVTTTAAAENADDVDDVVMVVENENDDSTLEPEIVLLRGRWELASVLNFLTVFEQVIGNDLKLTAEEIEAGLVHPSTSLAQLHINLLKGIPPVSKTLTASDAWVTVLCKKIAMWWPWVAEGELPLTAANGQEISRYKELHPTNRLQILKALCEIRADQDDAVSYINDSLKNGTEISCFRKDNIGGGDGNATCYWCDGGPVIGHRLYKEVKKTNQNRKMKGKASDGLSATSFEWQTLATNLEEFQKSVDELSSSKLAGEIAVGKTIETNFLPLVEKFQKKKERALKRKERQERLLNDFRSYATGITRSCRSRRPINYTFDDYDRAIDEAIEVTKKSKTTKEQSNGKKHSKHGGSVIGKESQTENDRDSQDEAIKNADSLDSETESDGIQRDDGDDDDKDDDYEGKSDNDDGNELGSSGEENATRGDRNCSKKPFGSRWSLRLAGVMNHDPVAETKNLTTKNRLRQRPTLNSALESIVLDSEDGNRSQNINGQTIGDEEDFVTSS